MHFFLFSLLIGTVLSSDCSTDTYTIDECFTRCRQLYSGSRNYYNRTTMLCESVTQCSSNEEYDNTTNTCSEVPPLIDNLTNATGDIDTGDETDSEYEVTNPTVKCVNGYYLNNSTLCVCYPGWETDTTNSSTVSNEILKCNVANENNSTTTNVTTETSNISLILSIAIPCVIGLMIAVWMLSCIIRKCKKEEVKPQQKIELKIVSDPQPNVDGYPMEHPPENSYYKNCLTDSVYTRYQYNGRNNNPSMTNRCLTYQTPNKPRRRINYYTNRSYDNNNSIRSKHSFKFVEGNCYPIKSQSRCMTTTPCRQRRLNFDDCEPNFNYRTQQE